MVIKLINKMVYLLLVKLFMIKLKVLIILINIRLVKNKEN